MNINHNVHVDEKANKKSLRYNDMFNVNACLLKRQKHSISYLSKNWINLLK